MKRRVFVAINLPEEIKEKLASYQLKWPDLPCRWTKKDNLHITLAFLGYLEPEEIIEAGKAVRETCLKHRPFFVKLSKIIYGPSKQSPRLVWVQGERADKLGDLVKEVQGALVGFSGELKSEQARAYIPHITLGRLRMWEFRRIEIEERPEINEDINLSFKVNSIEVMESRLKRGGAEYSVLESFPLSKLT